MAKIAVFEDDDSIYQLIELRSAQDDHEVVGRARTISEAHALLGNMVLGHITADYTLVDGNLDTDNQSTPDFISPSADKVTISAEGETFGQHGRQICDVIRACKIPTTVIGISGRPANSWGGEVDYDLTKENIVSGLLPLLRRIDAVSQH